MKFQKHVRPYDNLVSNKKLPVWPRTVTQEMSIFNRINAKKMKKLNKSKKEESNSEPNEIARSLRDAKDAFKHDETLSVIEMCDSSTEDNFTKCPDNFQMLNFRKKLRGTKFIPELQRFLYLMDRDSRIINKYIEMGGDPLELAQTLERVNKRNLVHISFICQALQMVVIEIISNYPTLKESAVSACRYFLNLHSNVIEQLLKSTQLIHRRIALKLLIAIVYVDPQLSGHVLTAFTMLLDIHWININLSHCRLEQHEQETVRKCFIKFVLAFFVNGNSLLIKNLLNCHALVQALVFGLLYDDHVTVCLVLNTMKKYILENVQISKTKKVQVFGLECCKRLVLLYDWIGPHGGQTNFRSAVNSEEKEAVAVSAHDFLLTLFSSHKDGIVFNTSTKFQQKHYKNIANKIIGFLQKPWNCKRKTELILKILKACPDIARPTMQRFSDIINPKRTDEKQFISIVNFLRDIISTLNPQLLENVLKQIKLTDSICWIKEICLPFEALIALRNSNMLVNSHFECRLATHRLLLAMFGQYSKFVGYVIKQEDLKETANIFRNFKFDLYDHILTYFPSIDNILESLNHITNDVARIDPNAVLKHLDITLDLILVMCQQDPCLYNRTSRINLLIDLYPLFKCEDNVGDGIKRKSILADYVDIQLELKVVKTILLLDPNALKPHEELFLHVLKSLIQGFIEGTDDVQRESGNLLRDIFRNTGIFDKSSLEIDLWLEALRCFDAATVEALTQNLIKVLKVNQGKVDLPGNVKSESNMTSEISRLLPLVFEAVVVISPPDKYIELICLLLFHYHPKPANVAKLYELKYKRLPRYMRTWLSAGTYALESKSLELPKLCDRIPFLKEFQIALLKGFMNTNFEDIFGSNNDEVSFKLEVKQKKYKLHKFLKNERLQMIYIQQVIFLLTQLLKKQQLTRAQSEFAAKCVINFLAIVHTIQQENTVNDISYTEEGDEIVRHSFLGKLLTYIYDTRLYALASVELFISKNPQCSHFLHFLRLITEYCSSLPNFLSSVKNFRLKIFKAAAIKIESVQQSRPQSNADFIKIIEALQIDVENCKLLLDMFCKNLSCSDFFTRIDYGFQRNFYYDLLICILKRLTELQQTVDCEEYVKVLAKYYVYFITKVSCELNLEDFENAFYDYFCIVHKYIPRLDAKVFTCIFGKREITLANKKLARLLLERYNNLDEHFLNILPYQIGKRELIFPLLEVALNKNLNMDKTLLMKIYQVYRNGILKTIEDPQKADIIYKEHAACSVQLVESCMPVSECMDFCKKRFEFNDTSELYQILLINAIFEKVWNAQKRNDIDEYARIFVNFLSLQIQLLSNDLRRHSLNVEKLEQFVYQIDRWFSRILQHPASEDYDFEITFRSQHWLSFCKSCLEHGMRTDETNENVDTQNGLLLKLMTYLCDKFYVDFEGDTKKDSRKRNKQSESTQLFQLICTHSNYYDIMLSTKPTKVKTAILNLLLTLAKKSPRSAIPYLQIPIILIAFHGEQSEADRCILALLGLCELYNPHGLQQYHPFIWRLYSMHVIKPKKKQ